MRSGKEYKERIESRHGKALREIMYDLCINQGLDAREAADELEVPRDVFLAWRGQFGYGSAHRKAESRSFSAAK